MLCLGVTRKEGPLKRRGPPRHRQLRLGEHGDSRGGLSGLPRRERGIARLGKPLHLGVPAMVCGEGF